MNPTRRMPDNLSGTRTVWWSLGILFCLTLSLSLSIHADETRAPSRFAKLDGGRVHYKSYGKGREALVFVHGWSCDMNFWKDQAPDFTARTRVILLDLPGHGLSDKPDIPYTMDLFARAVEVVMREAGVKRAVLVGHSMGTPVIRQFYRRYPDKTVALVIVDGSLRPFGDKANMEKIIAPLRGPNYREAATKFIDSMLQPTTDAQEKAQILSSMLRTPQHVALSAFEGMLDAGIWKQDPINVPVLTVMAKSSNWPEDNERFYRSLAPRMDYKAWTGVSHFLMLEKPKEFNQSLADFLVEIGFLRK